MSFLQNGSIPFFISEDQLQKLFSDSEDDLVIYELRKGMSELGIIQVFFYSMKCISVLLSNSHKGVKVSRDA